MANEQVAAKTKEIAERLSKETGVAQKDVEAILERLGLASALQHRSIVGEVADREGLGHKVKRLTDVSLDNIRIAAGQINE